MQSDLSSSDLEEMDRGVMLTGVWMVMRGRPVWVQALCQMVEVEDRRANLDDSIASINIMPKRVNRGSTGDRFLEDMVDGSDGPWGDYNVRPAQVDCILAMLGLFHVRMKCVIDPECDVEEAEPQVRRVAMCCHKLCGS
jgi:hypothetical protein